MKLSLKAILAVSLLLFSISISTFFIKKKFCGSWVKIKDAKISDAIYGLAIVESENIFRYRSGITSQVKKLFIKEGASVKKGDMLMLLADNLTIKSPFDGVVTQLDAKENETVFPNTNLITVMNLDLISLTITIEQASALRIKVGLKVKVQFESMKGAPIDGFVRSIYPKEGQFIVKVDLKQRPASILPGMTADTAIIVGEKEHAMLIPIRAVSRGMIHLKQNGDSFKTKAILGFQDSEYVEILEIPKHKIDSNTEVWVSEK